MTRISELTPQFVEYIPEELREGVLYVSMVYATSAHLCCCGCGQEVVTTLSPTDWQLKFDGRSVSLTPSVGNWNFPCQSHYWIIENRVKWSARWSMREIEAGRARDQRRKADYFGERPSDKRQPVVPASGMGRLLRRLLGRRPQ